MNILGIDVGMSGAFAFYNVEELIIYDTPTFERNKTKRLDCHAINKLVKEAGAVDHCYIEQVNAFGMGASSAFNFGYGCGVIEAIIAANNIPYTFTTPQKWKKSLACPKEKDGARGRATQLLPLFAHNWELKKHDGRAEASLIALYGYGEQK